LVDHLLNVWGSGFDHQHCKNSSSERRKVIKIFLRSCTKGKHWEGIKKNNFLLILNYSKRKQLVSIIIMTIYLMIITYVWDRNDTVIQGTGGGLELFCYNTWVSLTQKMLGTRSVSNFVGFFVVVVVRTQPNKILIYQWTTSFHTSSRQK
jgi:hypothetical protein